MTDQQIAEYVGAKGVKSSNRDRYRLSRPQVGDLILWPNGKVGRIEAEHDSQGSWAGEGEVHVCCELGSAFLGWDAERNRATLAISGGPFMNVKLADLAPTYHTRVVRFWNWGNNSPGAGKGVDYYLARPVFEYVGESDHYAIRDES